MTTTLEKDVKWTEISSLIALSASIAISWIAYHEYQPHLLERFNFRELATFLIISKGIILVITPPLAGWLADLLIKKTGNFFLVFSIGISATAMIFMTVASVIGIDTLASVKSLLPYLIILWLISMNIFVSPAISMLDSFATKERLPFVVAVLFLVTELVYALEPLVIDLVNFFGATLTFVVGGVLIAGTGYLFQKSSSDEVAARRTQLATEEKKYTLSTTFNILLVGIILGTGKAVIVEYIPHVVNVKFESSYGGYLSFGLLGFSAVVALLVSKLISKMGLIKPIVAGSILLFIALGTLLFASTFYLFVIAGIVLAISFAILNVSGLPYAIEKLTSKNITMGIGVFLGASEIAGGVLEYIYQ